MFKASSFLDKVEAAFRYAEGAPITLRIMGQCKQFTAPLDVVSCNVVARGKIERSLDRFNGSRKETPQPERRFLFS